MFKNLKEHKNGILQFLRLFCVVFGAAVIVWAIMVYLVNKPVDAVNSNVYITAAHLDDVAGYTLMYKDSSRDVAYYIKNKRELTILGKQSVKIENLTDCKIVSSTPGTFIVSTTSIQNIDTGLSGCRVYSKSGTVLGFIISIKGTGLLECRTLE